jgi:N4-(beta-N-acetylglucosaminyl)-L-asparaginase
LRRIAKTTEPRLRDREGRPDFGISFYLMSKDGRYAGVTMHGEVTFAVTDSRGSRLEKCRALYPA